MKKMPIGSFLSKKPACSLCDFNIQGFFEYSDEPVYWEIREDYSSLVNGNGVVFQRVEVK